MGNRKPNLANLLAFLPPQEQFTPDMLLNPNAQSMPQMQAQPQAEPLSMVNQINRSQTSSNASPQLGYGQQFDQAFYKQMQDRAEQDQALQKQMQELQSQKPNAFREADLSTLLAYGDQLSGSRLAQNYKAPTAAQERKAMIEKLRGEITKSQQSMGDDQLAYLKQKAQEQRDVASEKRMLAKLGGAQKSVGWDAADRDFAKEYSDWNLQGGYKTAEEQAQKLEQAAQALKQNPSLSGGNLRFMPEFMRERFAQQSFALQQAVESAVQGTLKLNLGGQFTEKEGANVLKRTFNPNLPVEANIKQMEATAREIRQRAVAKDQASKAFLQGGTVRGFSPQNLMKNTITVSNGKEVLEIEPSDLQNALTDGYTEVK